MAGAALGQGAVVLLCLVGVGRRALAAATYYVAADGTDTHPGTRSHVFGLHLRPSLSNSVIEGNRICNNILHANQKAVADAGTGTVLSHNLGPAGTGAAAGAHPLFADAAAGDFRLRPASPAIDAGASLKEVPSDFDGAPRPQGAGHDMGAFELKETTR
jgi:hypothetical protein